MGTEFWGIICPWGPNFWGPFVHWDRIGWGPFVQRDQLIGDQLWGTKCPGPYVFGTKCVTAAYRLKTPSCLFFKHLLLQVMKADHTWRGMIIKDNEGDWGICVAAWRGMKKGKAGIPGEYSLFTIRVVEFSNVESNDHKGQQRGLGNLCGCLAGNEKGKSRHSRLLFSNLSLCVLCSSPTNNSHMNL